MIDILPSVSWREFRGEPANKGMNLTTHLASIEDASGKLHSCYVKLCPQNWPSPITEAIGWQLIRALNLPAPEFAALVMVPLDKLRRSMKIDQHWLSYPEALAFCASDVNGKPITSSWSWLATLRKKGTYKKHEVAGICAFDYWVDNKDRNTGNMLLKKNGEQVAIDNEFILYDQLWKGRFGFEVGESTILAEAEKILSTKEFDKFKVSVARHGKNHGNAINAVRGDIRDLIFTFTPNINAAQAIWGSVDNFLISRADINWLSSELGVIV